MAARQRDEEQRPFDLDTGPLGRGRLLTLGPERHALLLTFHHSIYDGASMNVMMDELGLLYEAFAAGAPDPLPPLAVQFAEHTQTREQAVLDGGLTDQEEYWLRALDDAPPVLELPTDRPRPTEQHYAGGRAEFSLDAETTTALRGLARRHGATPFVAVLAGWAILLSRLSGQEDIVVGSPFANRRGPGAAGLIGFLVNSLPLRIDLSGSVTVSEALTRTRAVVREALAHQDLPFERIVELVNPPRSASRTPLFQTMLAWVPERRDLLHLPGVDAQPLPIDHAPAKFDLAVSATDSQGRISGHLDYATALLDHDTAERWAGHLRHLLTDMARHPERDVRALELMEAEERRRVLLDGDAAQPIAPDDHGALQQSTRHGGDAPHPSTPHHHATPQPTPPPPSPHRDRTRRTLRGPGPPAPHPHRRGRPRHLARLHHPRPPGQPPRARPRRPFRPPR